MSDTTQADASTRKRISKRALIDENGNVTTDYSKAAGVRLTVLHQGKDVHQFDEYLNGPSGPGTLVTQAACFGLGTKVGNVINSIVNADDYDGRDPTTEVKDWLDSARNGVWREPGEGPKGPKYDPAVIGAAIVAVKGEKAEMDAAGYTAKYLADKSYAAKVRATPAAMAAYWRLVAESGEGANAL